MNERDLAQGGEVLLAAYNAIVRGLAPFVESVLAKKFPNYSNQWFEAVNNKRQSKGPPQAKLARRPDGTVRWDITALCTTIEDFWPDFREFFEEKLASSGVTTSELVRSISILKNSIPLLKSLRNRASHFPASSFSERDRDRFLDLAEQVLRFAGLEESADAIEQLISAASGKAGRIAIGATIHDAPDADPKILLGDLKFSQVPTYPQWAATPKIVSLAGYRRDTMVVSGLFSTLSKYFRFGFKIMDVRDKLFSPGSIQTDGRSVVIHLGKDVHDNNLFIAAYNNAMRMGQNRIVMPYAQGSKIPVSMEVRKDGIIRLKVDGKIEFETLFQIDNASQLVILAWGDEHYFECEFAHCWIERI